MSEEEVLYEKPWRNTRMGGLTRYYAICRTCGIVKPYYSQRSKSGTHGEDFFRHEHQLAFLCIKRSNTGKRAYHIEFGDLLGEKYPIVTKIASQWEYGKLSLADVEDALDEKLGVNEGGSQ